MNKDEQLHEQYEDALFALLMNEVAEANGNELMQKNEELLADPDAAVPERLSKRCMQVIEKNYRKAQIQNTVKSAVRVLNRVALWILIPVFLFVGVFAASETVRVKTMNLLIREFNIGTEFRTSKDEYPSTALEQSTEEEFESVMPEGFSLVFSSANDISKNYIFSNNDDSEICVVLYSLLDKNGAISVDTENAEVWHESIGQHDVMFVQKEDICQATWADEATQRMYVIEGTNTSLEVLSSVISGIISINQE